jgi:NADH dehydrogenase [ubiquinone] 1 alpha subcomplex assembly factor 7
MIVETCAPAEAIAAELGRRIADHGGAALIIDYGDERKHRRHLPGRRGPRTVSPFADPGKADLTAHVAFGPLARAARPAQASALTRRASFSNASASPQRAQALATWPQRRGPGSAHRRTQAVDAPGRNGTPV